MTPCHVDTTHPSGGRVGGLFLAFLSAKLAACPSPALRGAARPGQHALTAALRALGLGDDPGFSNYHRLLNRARWSARQGAGILLRLLLRAFVPTGPVVLGLEETVERRRGRKVAARAI